MNKRDFFAVLLAAIFISVSEFFRNSFLIHNYWLNHFKNLGIIFPEQPINGAIWGLWSLCFSISIFILSKKFSLIQTSLFSWFFSFILMWLVLNNLGVLPIKILPIAIPLSIIESFVATLIIFKVSKKS